jgi:hypothetical protein
VLSIFIVFFLSAWTDLFQQLYDHDMHSTMKDYDRLIDLQQYILESKLGTTRLDYTAKRRLILSMDITNIQVQMATVLK